MRKLLFFIILALSSHFVNAQIITVRDHSGSDVVYNAIIRDKSNNAVVTGPDGKADVSTLKLTDSIIIEHADYFKWTGMLTNLKTVYLMGRAINLEEVVLSASRSKDTLKNIPFYMNIINQKRIEFMNPQTSADLLENAGILVQRSQAGGGSPVLRGFEASRVLLVVDGVRMNNAIYRAGHLQDVMTLDASMLEKTEVVFGPSSTAYGSDALGGVMHFYTKNAAFATGDKMLFKANAMTRYSSANNEMTGHLDFNLGFKKIAFLTNVTWSDFGDVRAGRFRNRTDTAFGKRYYYAERFGDKDSMVVNSNPDVQKGSAYDQLDVMQRINFKQSEKVTHGLNFQYSKNDMLPRYDRLSEFSGGKLKFAEWYYKQNRMLASYTLLLSGKTAAYDNARFILAYQNIDQERVNRRFNNNNRIAQMEDVSIFSFNADLSKSLSLKNEMKYGVEITSNNVQSAATKTDIVTGVSEKAVTRYPDGGSTFNTAAIYMSDNHRLNDNWILSGGLRFNYVQLKSKFDDTTLFPAPFKTAEQTSTALSGNLSAVYKPGNDWQLNVLFSSGFRAPNVDDLTKIFESGNGILIVPNPTVKPEYAYNTELGVNKIFSNKFRFNTAFFYTIMDNAMVQKDFTFNGNDSALFNGVMSKVQALQNANQAFIYGYNINVAWDIDQNFSIRSFLNYTHGTYYDRETRYSVPLDHVAPLHGLTGLTFKSRKFEAELFSRYSARKKLEDYSPSGEDNLQYATANGMPGWWTMNLRTAVQITKSFRATFAVENITDRHYRVFASGISAPGRNFVVSVRYKL